MAIVLARVDNRLIHGQVLEAWMPFLDINNVIIVDNGVAGDPLRQKIMEIAIPGRINCRFLNVDELKETIDRLDGGDQRTMVLFSNIKDVRDVLRMGMALDRINIGNIHYQKGKTRISSCVSLDEDELACLMEIQRRAKVEIQALPDDTPARFPECIEKGNGHRPGQMEKGKRWKNWLLDRLHLKQN